MSILRRFLPQRVNFRCTSSFHHLREADGLYFQQFHMSNDRGRPPSRPLWGSRRARRSRPTKLPPIERSPPGNRGKEDRTTVAAFLPWRGLPVLNPQPLTEQNHSRKIDILQ